LYFGLAFEKTRLWRKEDCYHALALTVRDSKEGMLISRGPSDAEGKSLREGESRAARN